MSYTINLTNGNVYATIPDGTINTSGSMTLVGKNYAGYGAFLDTNFVHLMENSANPTPPPAPVVGQLWFNTTSGGANAQTGANTLSVATSNTSGWKTLAVSISSATAPSSNANIALSYGDMWFDTVNQQLNVYNGNSYVLVGPSGSSVNGNTGAYAQTVNANSSPVVLNALYDRGDIVAVASSNPPFNVTAGIPGFSGTIRPGITFMPAVANSGGVPNGLYGNVVGGATGIWINSGNIAGAGTFIPAENIVTSGGGTGNIQLTGNVEISVSLGVGGNVAASGIDGVIDCHGLNATNTINSGGNIVAAGNVLANFFIGDGSQLANVTNYSDANTAAYLNNPTGVIIYSLAVGNTAPSGQLGEIRATNNITAYYSSDAKFKTNVQPIQGALSKVECIGGKTFDWTDEYIAEHGGEDGYFITKNDYGVVAQDVQKVFPQAVRTREDGTLAVDYAKLTALAFAAIAELSAEVTKLKEGK